MTDKLTQDQKFQALFYQLIMSFQAAAMQQMGKLKNPFTDKIEKELTQAQLSIDMLDMLKQKTEGHRTKEETDFIEHTIRELKLNYVDEMNKTQSGKKEPEQSKESKEK